MKPRMAALCPLGLICVLVTGCGTSLLAASPTAPAPSGSSGSTVTPTTAPLNGEVAVAFPVVACTSASGASLGTQGWRPSVLLAPIPTALVGKVEFYSDGIHTLLGPSDWSCSQVMSTQSGNGLVVYPSNNPNPPVFGPPTPGTEGVFATFDSTGRTQGVAMVCPFFTVPSWQQQEASCSPNKPTGEVTSMPTPDVASVTDPAGVVGSLEASGGAHPVTGAVIFPQVVPAVTNGSSIAVAEESCSLADAALCQTVLSDFEVREFPILSNSSG
jgi:hypothetical protein